MKTKVINFVGSPSIGKSLMSALTFAEMKMRHITCELVQEFAKQLVWQERFDELNNQWFVSDQQYKMFKAVDTKVDYIVTDSPLVLGRYYNLYHKENVSNIEKTEIMIDKRLAEFDNIYIFLERNEEFQFEKEGRIHNEEQSREIEEGLLKMLDELGVTYLKVKSCRNNIEKIIDYILE